MIIDYYKNNENFYGSINEDLRRLLKIFLDQCQENSTEDVTCLRHFSHYLFDASQ